MRYRQGNAAWQRAEVRWTEVDVRLSHGGKEYTWPQVVHDNGERDGYATLAGLAGLLAVDGIELAGCASCARFRFSGMSAQMSGGMAGYCTLVGFRSRRGVVGIDHGCGEHTPVAGWPNDLDAALEARRALSDREPQPSRRNAIEGAILGLAIGDAVGFPAEFHRRSQIIEAFGPQGLTDFVAVDDERWPGVPRVVGNTHRPGTYSDDTQMSVAVARALIDAGRDDLDTLMQRMADYFVRWSRSEENDRAPGSACMAGCERLAAGVAWGEAGVSDSKGCGSAMRVAPIGLFYWRDHERLLEVARASSILTHGHDAAIEGAAAASLLVALALEKRPPREMYEAIMDQCAPRSADLKSCLEKLPALVSAEPDEVLSARGLGEGWVAEEAVASALYCFWRSPEDFRQTILMAANTDGDSDSIASIAGGISGAFNGAGLLPDRWRDEVENAQSLVQLADRLWQACV